jgi:hypothetical protein
MIALIVTVTILTSLYVIYRISTKSLKETEVTEIQIPEVKEEPIQEPTPTEKPKRARKANGRFKGDDPSTPDINEAWVDGKAPEKKAKPTKKPKIKIVK